MPIAGTELTTNGTTSPSTSVATASITPTANRLVLAEVRASSGGGTAPPAPTLTGNGLTWVQIATRTYTDGATETHRITRFRAMGASPTTGAVTIAHSTAPNSTMAWSIREYSGVDTSGSNGSGAVVQTVTNGGTGTAASVTLAAFGSGTNGVDIAVGTFAGTSLTPEAGYTGYTQASHFGNLLRAAWDDVADTSPSMTIGSSTVWAAIATEIKEAGGGGGSSRPYYYNMVRAA